MSASNLRRVCHPGRRLGLTLRDTRRLLDGLAGDFSPAFLDSDPLGLVREWDDPGDREIAAFLAAGLAYGRVASIRASLRELFARLGSGPGRFVDEMDAGDAAKRLRGFRHRFTSGHAIAEFLERLRRARAEAGSLEQFFLDGDLDPSTTTLDSAMDSFVGRLFDLGQPSDTGAEAGARWLLPAPSAGSACKRHCLVLRWLVRPDDGLDCGLWTRVKPSRLVLPLDTHLQRVVRALGWTNRTSVGWSMALDATACLRRLDPDDPVRYDFALSRLGILGLLPSRRSFRIGEVAAAMGL